MASTIYTIAETSHEVLERAEFMLGLGIGGTYTAAALTYVFFPHIGRKPDEVFDTFDQMMISTLWLGLKEEFRPNPWKRTRPRW